MSKISIPKALIALLILQITILLFKSSSTSILQVDSKSMDFATVHSDLINKIKLEEPKKFLEIEKTEAGWVLPSANNFPADKLKVEKLLNDLKMLKATSPVATSLSAAKKLKTATNDFEKKVLLKSEKGEEVLFFGSSPTFKKLYGRVNGSDNTYIVDYQPTDISTNVNLWFNQDLLKIQTKELDSVEFQDIKLDQKDGILSFIEMPEGKELEEKELQGFVNKLTEISYSELPVENQPVGWEKAPLVVIYDLTVKGEKQNYLIKGPIKKKVADKETDHYFLKASHLPYYFEISKFEVDSLTAFSLEKMFKTSVLDKKA